MIINTN